MFLSPFAFVQSKPEKVFPFDMVWCRLAEILSVALMLDTNLGCLLTGAGTCCMSISWCCSTKNGYQSMSMRVTVVETLIEDMFHCVFAEFAVSCPLPKINMCTCLASPFYVKETKPWNVTPTLSNCHQAEVLVASPEQDASWLELELMEESIAGSTSPSHCQFSNMTWLT